MEPKPGRTPEEEALQELQEEELNYLEGGHAPSPKGHHNHSRYHKEGMRHVEWTDNIQRDGVHRRGPPATDW